MFNFFSNHGVLGLNARSLLYIKPFNPKKATALADSKLKTKAYLAARGIPVAKLYGRIETREQLHSFDFSQLPSECVLKPNYGYGGEGIIVLKGRDKKGNFLKNGKAPITNQELIEHVEDVIDGKFSLKGRRDTAFFEQILVPHDCFARFRPVGLPDIRVIVFNLVPVMAMLRIPTAESEGKANIHMGGIGLGIDIAKGVTTHAAQFHSTVNQLPHGEAAGGHAIPYWDDILLICSRIQQITNIGYLAVDITIDQQMGPSLLEVNARAGLMVQTANLAPLRTRLERVAGLPISTPEKAVRMGQDLFGHKTKSPEKETESAKPTLGIHEPVDIALSDGSSIEVRALIASDQERTSMDPDLIEELLQKGGAQQSAESERFFKVKCTLAGKKMQTVVESKKNTRGKERVLIGRRDLGGFLIDPSKKTEKTVRRKVLQKLDLRGVDRTFGQIDRQILLLKHVKPINLEEEMQRLREDELYNPTFSYPELPEDIDETQKKLEEMDLGTSVLGKLLEKKRKELLTRIALLRARGNAEEFTKHSTELFGVPTKTLLKQAEKELAARKACNLPVPEDKLLTAEQAAEKFEQVLQKYSLHNWKVSVRQKLVADATVGGNSVYVRADAKFTDESIASLIAHEIETHVLTAENGDHQHYQLLRRGSAGYLDTQEGLAIYNQNMVLSPFSEKRYNPPRNLLGLAYSLDHSLAQTRTYLQTELGASPEKALTLSVMMKRGLQDTSEAGGFTKTCVYYRGLKKIEKYVKEGGDMKRLYIGKLAIEDLDLIEQLPDLEPPLLFPEFLRV